MTAFFNGRIILHRPFSRFYCLKCVLSVAVTKYVSVGSTCNRSCFLIGTSFRVFLFVQILFLMYFPEILKKKHLVETYLRDTLPNTTQQPFTIHITHETLFNVISFELCVFSYDQKREDCSLALNFVSDIFKIWESLSPPQTAPRGRDYWVLPCQLLRA